MARLPVPGSDDGSWGDVLNAYLQTSHKPDGTLKDDIVTNAQLADDAVTGAQVQDGSIAETQLHSDVQAKLNATTSVTSVAGKTGAVTLTKSDVGLANVDNTSDVNKPISSQTQTALNTLSTSINTKLTATSLDSQTAANIADSNSATNGALVTNFTGTTILEYNGSVYPTRPSVAKPVIWVGPASTAPSEGLEGDLWVAE